MLSLTSRMQRLCVESWTVGLLYRCWEQLLWQRRRWDVDTRDSVQRKWVSDSPLSNITISWKQLFFSWIGVCRLEHIYFTQLKSNVKSSDFLHERFFFSISLCGSSNSLFFFVHIISSSPVYSINKKMVWIWGWLVVTVAVLVEWRFFIEVSGEQCVMLGGIWLMLQWCVESWTVENL